MPEADHMFVVYGWWPSLIGTRLVQPYNHSIITYHSRIVGFVSTKPARVTLKLGQQIKCILVNSISVDYSTVDAKLVSIKSVILIIPMETVNTNRIRHNKYHKPTSCV